MSYKVYRAVNDQATYALIAENVTETAYSYDLTDLAAGDQLVLRVTAVNVDGKENETEFFGFHIHQGESCSGTDFSGTGSHYDPAGKAHPKHAGDLPPLLACGGNGYLSVKTDRLSVQDIIGRTVVIHSDPDDFRSQPAGNAGRKNACGVIQRGR